MDLHLTGRTAVVTGASRGIGLATAERLTEEGARVLGVARRSTPELDKVADEVVTADLARPEGADAVADALEGWAPAGIDVLVNNAGGIVSGGPDPAHLGGFATISDTAWQATLDLNLLSAVRVTRVLIDALLRRRGVIVNVSSIGARMAHPPVDYGAAKAAMTNLTKALSEEYAPRGMRAVTVSPGPTRTGNWTDPASMAGDLAHREGLELDEFLARLPGEMGISTGRLAEPEETAATIAFLASPHAANITGIDVVVDGGVLKTV
ncbi:SDR family oxidoreductase [Actinomycetospora soli]|uniref:SDR family oxidoreductase n=1 Tax=Actinomycetospora soli TaxID=2893887 RepID=UPI001E4F6193|nr:SDR family oxidoreductase [Actinomycetospora soli]MCD2190397.1 SDR family oxidoreductase [Actinomycetospora soli]